jgi:Glycosyl transferase family 90
VDFQPWSCLQLSNLQRQRLVHLQHMHGVQALQRAIDRHQGAIIDALPASMAQMVLYLNTLDHPVLHPANAPPGTSSNWALPVFSWCAGPAAFDVPVPDFTFASYPQTILVRTFVADAFVC